MPRGKRQRKFVRGVGIALAVIVVVWFSLPLWFPWVCARLAAKYGVHYARYERVGYQSFALREVTFTNRTSLFRAERVEALVPNVWLWRCFAPKTSQPQPFIRVDGWQFESVRRSKTGPASTYTNFQKTAAVGRTLQRWLPAATLSNGTLRVPKEVVHLPAGLSSPRTFSRP